MCEATIRESKPPNLAHWFVCCCMMKAVKSKKRRKVVPVKIEQDFSGKLTCEHCGEEHKITSQKPDYNIKHL